MSFDIDDEEDVIEEMERKVDPKDIERPVWTTIEPFLCYFCKKLNKYEQYDIFEDKDVPYKVPINDNCSLPCKFCHTSNIVIDPFEYFVKKEAQGFENMTSLIY